MKLWLLSTPSIPLLLQVLLSLSTDIIKDSYQYPGGNMDKLPDLKKRTVATVIVQNWGEMIRILESDAYVSQKCIVL